MLTVIVTLALVATGLACLVRALPFWPTAWLYKKPFACPLCMSFWSTLAACFALAARGTFVGWGLLDAATALAGAVGLATFATAQTGMFAPPLPPDLGGDP